MATLDQDRAIRAHKHVSKYTPKSPEAKEYATFVHKLPSLIASAGLCQSLHFIHSRGKDEGNALLAHLAEQLRRVDSGIAEGNAASLLEKVRTAELGTYLHLTREALQCAAWYRRMVQGVLKVEMADADRDGEVKS
jgi:CRISPR-associated protein Cmr5